MIPHYIKIYCARSNN